MGSRETHPPGCRGNAVLGMERRLVSEISEFGLRPRIRSGSVPELVRRLEFRPVRTRRIVARNRFGSGGGATAGVRISLRCQVADHCAVCGADALSRRRAARVPALAELFHAAE